MFVNDRAPAWICPICFPLSCIGTIQGFQTQPTCGPIKLLHMTATFGSNCWRTVKHFANPERLLHFHQPCFENRLKSPPQPPPPTISLKKKNFMKDFCLYSGPCKMVTATGYGGHNYLSTQRKIQMSKDSGHLACRGPGQAAVTHQACQAAPLPLQAGSILTHSFAR